MAEGEEAETVSTQKHECVSEAVCDVMTHSFVCTSVLEEAVSATAKISRRHHAAVSGWRCTGAYLRQCRMHAIMQAAPQAPMQQRRRRPPPMELLFTMMRLLISIGLLACGVSGK
jgi:hypothetical protein